MTRKGRKPAEQVSGLILIERALCVGGRPVVVRLLEHVAQVPTVRSAGRTSSCAAPAGRSLAAASDARQPAPPSHDWTVNTARATRPDRTHGSAGHRPISTAGLDTARVTRPDQTRLHWTRLALDTAELDTDRADTARLHTIRYDVWRTGGKCIHGRNFGNDIGDTIQCWCVVR